MAQVLGITAMVGAAVFVAYLIRIGWRGLGEIEKLKH
jgi:hypothetical protein